MSKNFVYAEGPKIVFCPDDVVYLIEDSFHDWDKETHSEYVVWSAIQLNDGHRINFESKYFEEVKNLLVNVNKIRQDCYDTVQE